MENKVLILLENLNIKEQVSSLLEAKMTKVRINPDNEYIFYLQGKNLLPFEEYSILMRAKDLFPYPCSFYFEYIDNQYDQEQVLLYTGYVLEIVKEKFPVCAPLTIDNFKFEDKFLIEACNEIQLEQLKKLKTFFEKIFKSVGIVKEFDFFIDENNEVFKNIQKEMETFSPVEIDMTAITSSQPATNTYNKQNFKTRNAIKEMTIDEIDDSTMENNIVVKGYIFKSDLIKTRAGKHIQSLWITDYTNSIIVKRFENNSNNSLEELKIIGKGQVWAKVRGETRYDAFAKETVIIAREVETIKGPNPRVDYADEKRVELHTHSKMSAMDGIGTISEYVKAAASWGHKAIAITDRGNVQSFPEAQMASTSNNIKMIYGVELNMVEPMLDIVYNEKDVSIEHATYVSFDLETTGLSVVHDGITEFGAVKIRHGEVIERLQSFINPGKLISTRISNLTSITNDMVANAPTIEEFLPKIIEFFDDCILVAHNAKFDVGFLNHNLKKNNYSPISNAVVDSLSLARIILKPMKSYRLGNVCRLYRVNYDDDIAHRADYDAEVLGSVFNMMLHQLMQDGKYNLLDIANLQNDDVYKIVFPYHMTAIALNKVGLKNMFKVVSEANTKYFFGESRIPKERLEFYHEGMLFGSSCYRSDVFEAAMNESDERLESVMEFYDYIEIQPLDDYYHLVDRGKIESQEDVIKSLQRLIAVAKKQNKIIVATGDVHFLEPKDKIYRDVFISNPTIGLNHRAHPLCDRKNPKAFNPNQYLRTTEEMLNCYSYLPEEEAYQYVVTNTNLVADMVEEIKPVHDKLFTPSIAGADEKLRTICYDNAHRTYGNPLPVIVEKRLEKELGNIIKHGFGVIYYIAHKLVKKSNEDGYLVGSRGSVGSSFVATMADITEVNPLPPHYVCLHCGHSEFLEEGLVANGYDLEPKECPKCHQQMKGEGHNIPFETFLGFNADKVPDIDLNFSGAYQSKAHDYTKVLFGEDKVFRAGTISTVAEKTAYGYAKGYAELNGIQETIRSAELERIAAGCGGVKRTTGQHPGGIIVIPNDMDVFDFTPVQFPADDLNSSWKTTHFDFHAIHDNVLKLDILGHVDPTVIRALQDLTGVDPKKIPTNDKKVMSLFSSTDVLGIDLSYINCCTGALGLPEFGTSFVRGMLEQTNPKTFNDLVIISGLSHGTDVYLNNAETLIKSGTCNLSEVIGCRDDIMVYLIEKGLPNKDAFDIMEVVRKGKSAGVFPQKNYEELMKEHNVPQWYIDSCKKIKYMFPKAHAAAYVLSAIRVAWWKLYYPREYYAVYFSTRCDFFDIETLVQGKAGIMARRGEIEQLRLERNSSNKDEGLWDAFEIALEMIERGYHINPVSLDISDATSFILDPDDEMGLIPPFTAIDSLGVAVANTVVDARVKQSFISKEDVIKRTKLNNSHIKTLAKMGVFRDMQEENQLSLF